MEQRTVLIGLGNPGSKFEGTRHNLGKRVVQHYTPPDERVIRFVPTTFMNESGMAVAAFLRQHHLDPAELLLIHDDLELPLGQIAFKAEGSAKGHNGVRSVHDALQTQAIPRLRLGIGRPPVEVPIDQFVLERFTPAEEPLVNQMMQQAEEWLNDYLGNRISTQDH